MKSSIDILRSILADAGMSCDVSTTNDLTTIIRRVKNEGDSFLTITLPTFEKALTRALDDGKVTPEHFMGFQAPKCRELPRFLSGFLELIFDVTTGVLKDIPNVVAIQAIRQVCLLFSKIELPCTKERLNAAYTQYVQTEMEVRLADQGFEETQAPERHGNNRHAEFMAMCHKLWDDLLDVCERKLVYEGIIPKHGPGATADGVFGNSKYEHRVWTERLDRQFPHWEAGTLVSSELLADRLDSVTIQPPGAEIPVKVIAVPKTLKTPRIIAQEPTHMQYVQQGLLRLMRTEIAANDYGRNFVMFESQDPNRELARIGSITGTLATLDLSEASDRVSNQHVRALLSHHPNLFRAVDACRSRKADVPGKGTMRLAKFASMGSALTFPMEAMVFVTCIFIGIERAVGHQLSKDDIKSYFGCVRAFGDDLIVPKEYVTDVIGSLEDFGLRVNSNKSFWTGKFRESCGAEYYDGEDVTVVRCRRPLPESRKDVQELVSLVSFRNNLYEAGYWTTVQTLDNEIRKFISFPIVETTSTLLGRTSKFSYIPERWSKKRHSPLVKGAWSSPQFDEQPLEDYGALMKWFLSRGEEPTDRTLLVRSGRPTAVRLKRGWRQPY